MRIVILGAGPAGCATGIHLRERGHDVAIVDRGARPALVVGESLIPSVLLRLRELGLEEKVAAIGRHKPGAAIASEEFDWSLTFDAEDKSWPNYAYNVYRRDYDRVFQDEARARGCEMHRGRAVIENLSEGRVGLKSPENLPFDFLIDATGRARVLAAALGIGARVGGRRDAAIFSHYDTARLPHGGSIHMTIFDLGWSWRIPLRDRVSVGFVVDEQFLAGLGDSSLEQYEYLARTTPILAESLRGARRIEDVFRYRNYQLVSDRMSGPNWAMVGDAAGFVDPIFSSGVSLGLDGARMVADALGDCGDIARALHAYEAEYRRRLAFWQNLADTFYDRRFIRMIRNGIDLKRQGVPILEQLAADARVAGMLSGLGLSSHRVEERFYALLELAQRPLPAMASDACK